MLQELDGKVAVITGGGSGIGASLAEACAAEGMRVVVADINGDRAEAVASDLPDDTAFGKAVDVSDAAQVQELADFAFDTFGAVHLLCNNAGVSPVGRVWDYTDDDFRWARRRQPLRRRQRLRSFVPRMVEQGEGHIVNTGSGASFVSTPRLGPYCATKHAIVGPVGGVALRARRHGHRRERARSRGREHEHRRFRRPSVGRPRLDSPPTSGCSSARSTRRRSR